MRWDCIDGDPTVNDTDADGDGVSICDGDLQDDNPAVAFVSTGTTFAHLGSEIDFLMGSPLDEIGRDWDEHHHVVTLSRGFFNDDNGGHQVH